MATVKTKRLQLTKQQYEQLQRTPVDDRPALITQWTDKLNGIVRKEDKPVKAKPKAKSKAKDKEKTKK